MVNLSKVATEQVLSPSLCYLLFRGRHHWPIKNDVVPHQMLDLKQHSYDDPQASVHLHKNGSGLRPKQPRM